MERQQRVKVDVRDAVRVGEAEGAAAEHVGGASDAPARGRVLARVEARDLDRLAPVLCGHEVLDHLAQVAGQEDEAAEALGGVDVDDVPEDRLAADLDQRLRDRMRLLHASGCLCLRRGSRRECPPLEEG